MRKCWRFALKGALIFNAGIILYLIFTFPLGFAYRARFWLFVLEHLFTLVVFTKRTLQESEDSNDTAMCLFYLTMGNFFQFGALEVFLAMQPETVKLNTDSIHSSKLIIQIYIHLYYQINIYFVVFAVLSLLIMIICKIHEVSERGRMNDLVEMLEKYRGFATGEEEPCSICLSGYDVGE
jgi:4-hydroxybenzoate polyprenyltransferase